MAWGGKRIGVAMSLVMLIFDKPRRVPHVPGDRVQEKEAAWRTR